MFEKFTERSRKVMSLARQEAQRLHWEYIAPEHILLGILKEGTGTAVRVLHTLNVDMKRVRQELEPLIQPVASQETLLGQLPFSPPCKTILELAGVSASRMGQEVIGTEHLLIGLMQEGKSIAAQALGNLGLKAEEIQDLVPSLHGAKAAAPVLPPPEKAALARWAQSFRALADRPVLQDTVVELLKKGKSVALIGPAHVGKTSLVLALCRARAGGFTYDSVDYRRFDPLQSQLRTARGRSDRVLLIAEPELITASRSEALKSISRTHMEGERLIFEFRDGAFDAFAARYPNFAKSLAVVSVGAPDAVERTRIFANECARLKRETGIDVSAELIAETEHRATSQWPKLVAPWPALLALWKAVEIHLETEGKGDLAQLEKDIAELEQSGEASKKAQADLLRGHLEGLRSLGRSGLSIESVRRAIGELSGQSPV